MQVSCDNRGKKFSTRKCFIEKWKHHFCCRECYTIYKTEYPEEFTFSKPQDKESYQKINKLAKIYKERNQNNENKSITD